MLMRQRTSLGSSIQSHYDKIYIILWFLNTIVAKMRRICMANKKHKSMVLYSAIWLKLNHMQSQLSLKSLFVKKIPRETLSQITTNVNSKMILQIMNLHLQTPVTTPVIMIRKSLFGFSYYLPEYWILLKLNAYKF